MSHLRYTAFLTCFMLLILLMCFGAKADTPSRNEADTHSSYIPPIYPTEEEQTGKLWGTTEVLRCPNGTKLAMPEKSKYVCVPMSFEELNGQIPQGGAQ